MSGGATFSCCSVAIKSETVRPLTGFLWPHSLKCDPGAEKLTPGALRLGQERTSSAACDQLSLGCLGRVPHPLGGGMSASSFARPRSGFFFFFESSGRLRLGADIQIRRSVLSQGPKAVIYRHKVMVGLLVTVDSFFDVNGGVVALVAAHWLPASKRPIVPRFRQTPRNPLASAQSCCSRSRSS